MKNWIKHLKNKNLSKNTIKTYMAVIKTIQINEKASFALIKYNILNQNKSINSQRLYYSIAIEYCKFINNKKLLNQIKSVKLPPKPQIYMPVISKYRIDNLNKKIKNLNNKYWIKIIQFLFYTGIRANELKQIISIKSNSVIILGKGNKIREVFCNAKLLKEINEYNEIFPYTLKTLRIKIKKLLGQKYSCHSLRRSFATYMLKAGANPKMVQLQMGHKKIETTFNYLYLSYDYNLKIYNKFI